MNAAKAISEKKKANVPTGCLIVFGSIFLVAGLIAFWFSLVSPAIRSMRAASWPSTQATITHCDIDESHDDDGSSYKPVIHFSYEVDGQKLTSEKWAFSVWSASHKWAKSVTDRYPVGSKHDCFYNPNKPADAVLERHFQWINLLGLFTLLFVAVGGGVLWFAIRSMMTPKVDPSNDATDTVSALTSVGTQKSFGSMSPMGNVETPWKNFDGPQRLKPELSRMAKLVGTAIFAAIWNAISWFIFIQVLKQEGWLSFAGIFLTVFVGIGFLAGFGVLYQLLSLFNPVISVALSNGAVAMGETVDIAWETAGRAERISELVIELVGQEKATYTRGTSTYTDKKVFLKIPVVKTSDTETIRFGSLALEIPPDTMHTFQAPNNKIEWSFEVQGVIRWWPDVKESLVFYVKPMENGVPGV